MRPHIKILLRETTHKFTLWQGSSFSTGPVKHQREHLIFTLSLHKSQKISSKLHNNSEDYNQFVQSFGKIEIRQIFNHALAIIFQSTYYIQKFKYLI